ncbi:GntR family transcriptional regulator [Streptomyces sp. NPDC056486]|uniref:GntR family transcriptional regulator n=1 Tax=Streptomyces sp. NPDC056486 TaxID=3345835 RepID=UPI00368ED834
MAQVAAATVTSRIADGTYPVGARVPSAVELPSEFGIAASTAQKALTHLKAEGLPHLSPGAAGPPPRQPTLLAPGGWPVTRLKARLNAACEV